MLNFSFRILAVDEIPWHTMARCYDHTVFKSREWSDFLKVNYGVNPFVVEILDQNTISGYFYGQLIRKMGIKIIASPFEGWSTSYQGLSMLAPISIHRRIDIYEALISWLFKNKYCAFFQASDWKLELAECLHRGVSVELQKGYLLDLTQEEGNLYAQMSSRAKDPIKKSLKRGVRILECSDVVEYACFYQKQLEDVFKHQGMKPTHSLEQTISMLSMLMPDKFLALYAVDDSGECIASGFYVYDNEIAFYAGAASYKEKQNLCPNEPLMWEAIKELKRRGVKQLEFGGGRRYKEKYGPISIVKPRIVASRYKGLLSIKNFARTIYYAFRGGKAHFKGLSAKSGDSIG